MTNENQIKFDKILARISELEDSYQFEKAATLRDKLEFIISKENQILAPEK